MSTKHEVIPFSPRREAGARDPRGRGGVHPMLTMTVSVPLVGVVDETGNVVFWPARPDGNEPDPAGGAPAAA